MPLIVIHTNLPQADIGSEQLRNVSTGSAEILGVEPKIVQVVINAGSPMMFGGTEEPTAMAFVHSAGGKLKQEANDEFSAKFTDLIVKSIGVPKERIYMLLDDVPQSSACYMGLTIASLTH
ncbi:macrophage migration inhibitory factor homolog [Liolophura sinensis]|uniref:macrophage migration inhibitory factor homolog n=1 Tax=Liolophura sinensis TaxID=3198878 RepID=UPI0031583464